jgi:hypothetical protein
MAGTSKLGRRGAVLAVAVLAGVGLWSATASAGSGAAVKSSTVYSTLPSPLKGNLPSEGFEAYALTMLGDDATFAPGTGRRLTSVSLGLSSWGCVSGSWQGGCVTPVGATFPVPMTLTVYKADHTTVLASSTATFAIPYRPSASPKCTGANAGKYYDSALKACFNGDAVTVTFPFAGEQLDQDVVWAVTYNTTSFGPNPLGTNEPCFGTSGGCGYDSLNVLLNDRTYAGTQQTPGQVYVKGPIPYSYCDGGVAGLDVFRLDSPTTPACWDGYLPAVAFKVSN